MGMYTELFLRCSITNEAAETIKKVLSGEIETPWVSPRRNSVLTSNSHYHFPFTYCHVEDLPYIKDDSYFFLRSDLKNYDDDIQIFLNWLMPHVTEPPGKFIGYSMYEEASEPTHIFTPGGDDD